MPHDPLNAELSKASHLLARARAADAKPILLKLLKKRPKAVGVLRLLALACDQLMEPEESSNYIEQAKKEAPNDPNVWIDAARLCKGKGRFEEGLAFARKAFKLAPSNKDAFSLVAKALIWNGAYSDARAMLAPSFDRGSPPAVLITPWIDANYNLRNYDIVITTASPIREHAPPGLTDGMRREILSRLGLSLEQLGRFKEAAEVFAEKNSLVSVSYSRDESEKANAKTLAAWTPGVFASGRSTPLAKSTVPVFVLGFARSGTTLIERIIAAHPKAYAAGECQFLGDAVRSRLPEGTLRTDVPPLAAGLSDDDIERIRSLYLRNLQALTGKNDRIVNKDLNLARLGGVIGRCFPNAPILVPHRLPEDIAISVWSYPFTPSTGAWAMRLEWIAHKIVLFNRMIDHWRVVLPNPILDVQYEALVADPEPHVRAIIDHVGLTWDDACLSHENRSNVMTTNCFVPTFSEHQVRQKIHQGSVGRGARFGGVLDPFREAFASYTRP